MPITAFCLIPPAIRQKQTPVSRSIRLPLAVRLQPEDDSQSKPELRWWLVVAPAMQASPRFRAQAEARWAFVGKPFSESVVTGIFASGEPNAQSGGIDGGQPGQLPSDMANFLFDPRNSNEGGSEIPEGATDLQVTIVPESGNNGQGIWIGCVIAGLDRSGNWVEFDPATRGT